ncbi:MAG: hypothetical protein IJB31_02815 [Akkermansia sp.]|nr:hypothetical protein [Akkermansia sp.]
MAIAVLLGYLTSAFFAFCGVVKMVAYLQHQQPMQDYAAFLNGLAMEGWALAVGTALYLLTQIAVQCEKSAVMGHGPILMSGNDTTGNIKKTAQKAQMKGDSDSST